MTGPGEGKIPLKCEVRLCSRGAYRPVDCSVYLHVKGYSLARVTHVDLEAPIFNSLLKPGEHMYCPVRVDESALVVSLRKPVYVNELGILVRRIELLCPALVEALKGLPPSYAYVGGKSGGIFLGFKKEYIERLEELAVKLGVVPRGRSTRRA